MSLVQGLGRHRASGRCFVTSQEKRLTPLEIIERAEARHDALLQWAVFWMSLGAILGIAGCLLVISLWGKL